MERRKTICVVTSLPEHSQAQRVLNGVFTQCEKYGYNVAVFASMMHLKFHALDQVAGEKNIYNLINYGFFDGLVLDTITLTEDENDDLVDRLIADYEKQGCKAPVMCVGLPYNDLPTVESSNEIILREMCRHAIEKHGCKDICILTGFKGHPEAENRLAVFVDEIEKHGLEVTEEHRRYGDFWYQSGEKLADDIADGKISKPDCVLCASDHMGLGLIQQLEKRGLRVPDDMVVLGFEGTLEAAIAQTSLTSYESNFTKSAADAVDEIRKIIDSGKEIIPYEPDIEKMLHRGMSCGCTPDHAYSAKAFRDALYYTGKNYDDTDITKDIDISLLMENYVSEQLTASETPSQCLDNIFLNTYLLLPYRNFYMCLRDDWLDTDADTTEGYPDKMRMVMADTNVNELYFCKHEESFLFDTELMIPRMHEYTEEPCVFYFSAIHFGRKMLGYAVLQRLLKNSYHMNLVYRNWLRLVNNSLEMVRMKYRYVMLSIHDKMTGVYNRRGMYECIGRLKQNAAPGELLLVSVIDMDGLKYINDNFGHSEGDFGIKTICKAALEIAGEDGICVRAGGDEFFVLRTGSFDESSVEKTEELFRTTLQRLSESSGKPYKINASIGCHVSPMGGKLVVEEALSEADARMYREKQQHKDARRSKKI